jgi:alkylmercury lyase
VLRCLLRGETVDPPSLSATAGPTTGTVAEALEALDATGVISLLDRSVRAAYPLSAVPTPHRILHDGATAYACCAIDALAVPSMVGGKATIESRCLLRQGSHGGDEA